MSIRGYSFVFALMKCSYAAFGEQNKTDNDSKCQQVYKSKKYTIYRYNTGVQRNALRVLLYQKYIRFYKLSPKSSLNLETSSSCQWPISFKRPKKKRKTLGSSTHFKPPMSWRLSHNHLTRSATYLT